MSWPADKPTSDGLTQVASGESLLVNQYICSPGDKARLMLEENGNLTIFKLKGKPHTINKRGKTLGVQLSNQEDGNLVLYDADGKPANWASNTKASEGEGPSLLTVSDEGRAIYAGPDGTVLWTSDGKGVGSKVEAAAKEPEEKPPMVEGGEAPPASVEKESTGVVQMASIAASGGVSDSTPIEFIAEVKDQWERDGRTMSKIEVYIVNKGQHNIMSLDVVVPEVRKRGEEEEEQKKKKGFHLFFIYLGCHCCCCCEISSFPTTEKEKSEREDRDISIFFITFFSFFRLRLRNKAITISLSL